ncbi:Phospholipase D epsilon [Apostasia shenzhenica]|uniref:Phospholipase D epsilon n=1 Tax=Apostasia shenzhenica TaxID=1088818 RepID=A0A2I0AFZ2_9ASPA|nr:Phospholipase D epsilon [Apostasia shenzhenica]
MRANLGSYFHGTLEVTIYRAVTPATCLCFAADHPASVSIEIDGEKVAETSREYDKEWNQKFLEPCAHPAGAAVVLALRTREFVLGRVLIPAVVLLQCVEGEGGFSGEAVSGAADQASRRGKAKIEFSIRFWPAGNSPEVVISSFPVRENCRVVLYQDAHHGDGFRPPVIAGEGRERRPRNLWEDVFRAIDGAEFFVCIAGWSLNPKLVLVSIKSS